MDTFAGIGQMTSMPLVLQGSRPILDRRTFLAGSACVLGGRATGATTTQPTLLDVRPSAGGLVLNGASPGPTLRVRLGDPVTLRLANSLAASFGLVFAGVRDGVAVAGVTVAPGGTAALRFTPPDAGTFLFHAAGPDAVAQTAAGLRGVLIVAEPAAPVVDADLLLALGDAGSAGAGVVVNGQPTAMAATVAPGARVRLRLANGCVGRIAVLALDGARPSVIAVDGQPSALFEPAAGTVPLGPGARFDLMFDAPATAGKAVAVVLRGDSGHPDTPVLALATAGKASGPLAPLAALPENPQLPTRIALERALRRTVTIAAAPGHRWTVNGVAGADTRPLFAVRRGSPVVLTLINRSDAVQPLEVAGQSFRILHDLDDGWDPYWRNGLLLAPGKTKHIAFVPDAAGRWALESGDLARRAAGLAASFEVR